MELLAARGGKLIPCRCVLPMGCHPEVDDIPYVTEEEVNFVSSQTGVLQWATKLGRIDIMMETNLMSSYRAVPRQGHLAAIVHIFGWLKQHPCSKLVFDDSVSPDVGDMKIRGRSEWGDFLRELDGRTAPKRAKAARSSGNCGF